jgi:hypothetical protein
MDAVTHFSLKAPLFRPAADGRPFGGAAFDSALREIVDSVHRCETPVVLTGPAGVGKSVLAAAVAHRLAASGVKVAVFAGPASVILGEVLVGVVLVDEADTASPARLLEIADAAKRRGATAVFVARDATRVEQAARVVRLAPMSRQESCDFLLDAAARSGRPDLFTPAAQDAVAAAARGIPRVLKRIANEAALEAMFEGGDGVEARHVRSVAAAHATLLPREVDYVDTPRAGPAPATGTMPRRTAPTDVGDAGDLASDVDPDDDAVAAPPPSALSSRSRFAGLDARGIVAGAAALALLVVAAAVYAIETGGADRLVALARASIEQRPAPLPASVELPPSTAPDTAIAIVDDVAATTPIVDPAASLAAEIVPIDIEPIDEVFAAPALPDPATPGYRPPSPALPTIAAARRAGIATTQDRDERHVSIDAPATSIDIGQTAPLASDDVTLDPVDVDMAIEN